jgi:hypothetical protein
MELHIYHSSFLAFPFCAVSSCLPSGGYALQAILLHLKDFSCIMDLVK